MSETESDTAAISDAALSNDGISIERITSSSPEPNQALYEALSFAEEQGTATRAPDDPVTGYVARADTGHVGYGATVSEAFSDLAGRLLAELQEQ